LARRNLAIQPGHDVLPAGLGKLTPVRDAQSLKERFQMVRQTCFAIFRAGDRLAHRIDTGDSNQLAKRLDKIEGHDRPF